VAVFPEYAINKKIEFEVAIFNIGQFLRYARDSRRVALGGEFFRRGSKVQILRGSKEYKNKKPVFPPVFYILC